MLKISIIDGHHQVESFTTKNGVRFRQYAYVNLGKAFPEQMKIPVENPASGYPVGEYLLDSSSFRIGNYGDLEVNAFNITLTPLKKPVVQAKAG